MKKRKNAKLPVEWYLPKQKRPFAYTTTATSDLIRVLYEEYGDLEKVYNAINYDDDAKGIVGFYLHKGVKHINIR